MLKDVMIAQICQEQGEALLKYPNVKHVGIGTKYIKGQDTGEWCIRIEVDKKVSMDRLKKEDRIPMRIQGIVTDVVVRESQLDGASLSESAQGGSRVLVNKIEGDRSDIFSGSLGCVVYKVEGGEKKYYILSNNHVLAVCNTIKKGTLIYYMPDNEIYSIPIAKLSDYVPINPGGINVVDCAIAEILNKSDIKPTIKISEELKGVALPQVCTRVNCSVLYAYGATSKVMMGIVQSINQTIKCGGRIWHEPNGEAIKFQMKGMMRLGMQVNPGDSGSVVIDENNNVIGIIVGRNQKTGEGSACVFKTAIDALGVQLATGANLD